MECPLAGSNVLRQQNFGIPPTGAVSRVVTLVKFGMTHPLRPKALPKKDEVHFEQQTISAAHLIRNESPARCKAGFSDCQMLESKTPCTHVTNGRFNRAAANAPYNAVSVFTITTSAPKSRVI